MTTYVTIGADVFTALGERPRKTKFTFTPTGPFVNGSRLVSDEAWTLVTDEDGNAMAQLPDAVDGHGIQIWSNLPGFKRVTIANYPIGVSTLVALIADYIVDPDSLGDHATAPEAAWWGALAQRVLTVNGLPADANGNVNTDGSDVDIPDLALIFTTALI